MSREPQRVSENSPRWLTWVTRISIVIGLIALVATIWIVGPAELLSYFRKIGWFFIVIVVIELISSTLDGTAVYFMARGPTWREAVVAQIAGRGINSITPGGNLGEAVKIGLLSRRCPMRRAVAAVMYVGIIAVTIAFSVIAVGTAATPFMFDMPTAAKIALWVGAAVAAGIAFSLIWLMHHGMLSKIASVLSRLHILRKVLAKWKKTLEEVDARLSGHADGEHRAKAIACIAVSQILQKTLSYVTVLAAGYTLSPGQFLAMLSAGVLVGWISTIIPMGLGISEGGNVALFTMIGAPASLGLALALARRVNQIVFASIGFSVLMADRLASHVHHHVSSRFAPKPTH